MRSDPPVRVYLTEAGEVCIETRRHRTVVSREVFQAMLDGALEGASRPLRRAHPVLASEVVPKLEGSQAA